MQAWIAGIIVKAILQVLDDPRFEAWLVKVLQNLEADVFAEIGRNTGSLLTKVEDMPVILLGELHKLLPFLPHTAEGYGGSGTHQGEGPGHV